MIRRVSWIETLVSMSTSFLLHSFSANHRKVIGDRTGDKANECNGTSCASDQKPIIPKIAATRSNNFDGNIIKGVVIV